MQRHYQERTRTEKHHVSSAAIMFIVNNMLTFIKIEDKLKSTGGGTNREGTNNKSRSWLAAACYAES